MAGMGLTQMNSLLSLSTSMISMESLNSSKVSVQGMLRIEKDEEKKAKLQERLQSIERNIYRITNEVNERLATDHEKICAEEAAKTEAAEKAEKSAETPKIGETAESGALTLSTDTVDISVFVQHVAASVPPAVSEIPAEQTANVGEVMDVKA